MIKIPAPSQTNPPRPTVTEPATLLGAADFVPRRLMFPNSWCGHLPFASWLIRVVRPKTFVELGTHTGNSYLGFCQSVMESGSPTRCFAVDTWQGDDHAGHYGNDVFDDLRQYHDPLYGAYSTLMRMTFDEAVAQFDDESIDLLHIDGLHTYEAVRHDFQTWLPKMATDSMVIFHDTHVFEREFGVCKLWEELKALYPSHLSFAHSNGLGVLHLSKHPFQWMVPESQEQQTILRYFTSLGNAMLERYQAQEQSQQANFLRNEINQHKIWEQKLEQSLSDFKDLFQAATKRYNDETGQLKQDLSNMKDDLLAKEMLLTAEQSMSRNKEMLLTAEQSMSRNLVWQILAIRRSTSWRLTAPLRILSRLAHGQFKTDWQNLAQVMGRTYKFLPRPVTTRLSPIVTRISSMVGIATNSTQNHAALAHIIDERNISTQHQPPVPRTTPPPLVMPSIDICVVTYNSSRWIDNFLISLNAIDYQKSALHVLFVDNDSTDDTLDKLHEAADGMRENGFTITILSRPNHGFGAGQNHAISAGNAPFCLVSNIDLEFESDSLLKVVSLALTSSDRTAAWELRQKPYEHPKFYDPITGITNWNSHACVLLRRSALEKVGLYDERLFMYGEDVDLSYRLRQAGYLLRYCPDAIVHHYSYEDSTTIKPLQYTGSTFANLYLRLKYGNVSDILSIPMMGAKLVFSSEAFPGARAATIRNLLKLAFFTPTTLLRRKKSQAQFPFRTWDYELAREGAFVKSRHASSTNPLVSVITRTYSGREHYLRQAILSVANQSYPNIEHIVIEDGGHTMRPTIEEISKSIGKAINYHALDKVGRSVAGNVGLSHAKGRWCLFLDDDDLLFADHIETLVYALEQDPTLVATYSLAWEIISAPDENKGYRELTYNLPMTFRQEFDLTTLLHHNFMSIQSVLFERRLFLDRGGFEEDMECLEDWMLWVKFAQRNRFGYVPKVTSMFRTPANQKAIRQRSEQFEIAYPRAVARNQLVITRYCHDEPKQS